MRWSSTLHKVFDFVILRYIKFHVEYTLRHISGIEEWWYSRKLEHAFA